jgi:hypothetical protein
MVNKDVIKKEVIAKVFLHKKANQKLVTIPKDSNIKDGDFVKIIKMKVIENGKIK